MLHTAFQGTGIVILLLIASCQAPEPPHRLQVTEKTIPMWDSQLQGIMTQKAKIEIGEEILGKSLGNIENKSGYRKGIVSMEMP